MTDLAFLAARNGDGAGKRVGHEQVEANAFFFCSFDQSLVKRLRQTHGELAAELHVLVIGTNRCFRGMLRRSFAKGSLPRSGWLLVSSLSRSGRLSSALGF